VSLVSGAAVIAALDRDQYEVIPIGITPQGRWVVGRGVVDMLKEGRVPPELAATLPADPAGHCLVPLPGASLAPWAGEPLDVIFPVLHGPLGEDGTVQGLLELADLPYVGAGVLGSALGMDKAVQKLLFAQAGLPVAPWLWLTAADWEGAPGQPRLGPTRRLQGGGADAILAAIPAALGLPCFVKPANMGSSVGISKAHDPKELRAGIADALGYDRKVVVEAAVPAAREIEVSVLGNDQPRASVPGEIVPSNEFYDYDAKYVDGASQATIPAPLPAALAQRARELALQAFQACAGEGMARVDFLLCGDTGELFVSELNTIPGFTPISMYPQLWAASGLPFPALLDELIRLALERHQAKRRLRTSYQPRTDWHRG
jgi:D-alanine-D-alanine ligase